MRTQSNKMLPASFNKRIVFSRSLEVDFFVLLFFFVLLTMNCENTFDVTGESSNVSFDVQYEVPPTEGELSSYSFNKSFWI